MTSNNSVSFVASETTLEIKIKLKMNREWKSEEDGVEKDLTHELEKELHHAIAQEIVHVVDNAMNDIDFDEDVLSNTSFDFDQYTDPRIKDFADYELTFLHHKTPQNKE